MATLTRLTDSCLTYTDDDGTTLFDPGFFTWESGEFDLDRLGEVQRVLITHEHGDHVRPDFVRWLVDRGDDVTVHSNQAVVDLLAREGIDATTSAPPGADAEDVTHEPLPNGSAPPNRSWTVARRVTHPGDSFQVQRTAPLLALPLLSSFGSATASVAFASRLGPRQVIPIHDFLLSSNGREMLSGMVAPVLADAGVELVHLDWGESMTLD